MVKKIDPDNDCQYCSGEERDVRQCKKNCKYTEYLERMDKQAEV